MQAGGGGGAAWETVNVLPAINSMPLRAAPVLAATAKDTEPSPLPVRPLEIVIHGTSEVAVHAQPDPAVTDTEPLSPDACAFAFEGAMEYTHGVGVGGGGGSGAGGAGGGGAGGGGVGATSA